MEFILRPWQAGDLVSLVQYANDRTVADNMMDAFPYPFTPSDGHRFLERFMAHDPQLFLAISVNGIAVGAVGIHPDDDVYRPFGSNTASQRVLEKAGFILEARLTGTFIKHGKIEDELIYAFHRVHGTSMGRTN